MPLTPQEVADLFAQLTSKTSPDDGSDTGVMNSLQPSTRAFNRVVDARYGQPTDAMSERISGMSQNDLALLDRHASGREIGEGIPGGKIGAALGAIPAGLAAAVVAGGYEGDKALTGGKISQMISPFQNYTDEEAFTPDETTSDPSMGNVTEFVRGLLSGAMERFGDKGGNDDYPLDSYDGGGPGDMYSLTDDLSKDQVGRERFVSGDHPYDIALDDPSGGSPAPEPSPSPSPSHDPFAGMESQEPYAGPGGTAPFIDLGPEQAQAQALPRPGTGAVDPAVAAFLDAISKSKLKRQ